MGKNSYQKAKELIENLKSLEGNTISLQRLRREIMVVIGRDELRVITPYLHLMADTGLIKLGEFEVQLL